MINPMDLTGKHIIVTGASSGIGKETAITIANLGGIVSLVARDESKLESVLSQLDGRGHQIISYDLKRIDGIEDMIKSIIAKNGKADGIVHCAGVSYPRGLAQTKFDVLHDLMLINFYSFIELSRCVSKKNNSNDGASIVVMSSTASYRGDKGKTAYSASKGAIDSAIKCMARELADRRIRVNSIAAGFVKTEMYDDYINRFGEEGFRKNVLSIQYMGLGSTNDISNAISYLLSDAAKFITGTSFVVDGGALS